MVKEVFGNLKKGRYVYLTWDKVNGDYYKVSCGVVRYWSIRECANGHTLITMKPTKNKKLITKVKYFFQGVEISEKEFYEHNEKEEVNEWFSKRLENIVKVGK